MIESSFKTVYIAEAIASQQLPLQENLKVGSFGCIGRGKVLPLKAFPAASLSSTCSPSQSFWTV
ncbi:hypothetical protein [Gloeocapsopsis sp. IPPAS B-1203]|uniref:hypothetical protein n=1 Tax=Gloeocapsopsis sp. IPPAS B-1203 TaxID=2049454 RepID=UPI00259FF737|nr:hypothetical protein [Gloeocapsopsis sp. IPPAS B-1203]